MVAESEMLKTVMPKWSKDDAEMTLSFSKKITWQIITGRAAKGDHATKSRR